VLVYRWKAQDEGSAISVGQSLRLWGLVDKGLHKPKVLLTVKTCSNFFSFFSPGTCQVSRGKNTKNCCIPSLKRPPNTGGNIGAGLEALNVKGSQHNDKSCLSHVKGPSIVLPLFTERAKCHGRPLKAAKLWPEVCTEHSPI